MVMASKKDAARHQIRLLPEPLANQIAAGEVILRPASVVKELLENAVDAQARHITLRIEEGGKKFIQVSDDGIGMDEVDARMSLERHATSKIQSTEDLWNIRTMGFRGEALPSIAAVARIEIVTRTREQTTGTRVVVEGGELVRQEPAAREPGTTVTVTHLFYYTPARKKFLKSDHTEFNHVQEAFIRVALAHPDIAFSLIHNDEEIYHLLSGTLRQRIVQLFGNRWEAHLVEIQEESPFGNLSGYLMHPRAAVTRRTRNYLFVNRRFVRHPHLSYAIRKAYAELAGKESPASPFYVLFIDVPPDTVDVNIHPSKTEVKFHNENTLFSFLYSTARQRLATAALGSQLLFEEGDLQRAIEQVISERATHPPAAVESESAALPAVEETPPTEALPLEEAEATPAASPTPAMSLFLIEGIGLVKLKNRTLLVDFQRALEQQFFLMLTDEEGSVPSQQLLVPEFVNLLPEEMPVVQTMLPVLRAAGFDMDEFGDLSFVLHALPAALHGRVSGLDFVRSAVTAFEEIQASDDAERARRAVAHAWGRHRVAAFDAEQAEELLAAIWSDPRMAATADGRSISRPLHPKDLRLLLDRPHH